jgi:hypothetical protein
MSSGVVYLLLEREFVSETSPTVFKVGRTGDFVVRMQKYPKKSVVIQSSFVSDMLAAEKELIDTLKSRSKQRLDIGKEYFECEMKLIQDVFHEVCCRFQVVSKDVVAKFQQGASTHTPQTPAAPPVPPQLPLRPQGVASVSKAHNTRRPPYQCPRCGYVTVQKAHMRRHLLLQNVCPYIAGDIELTDHVKDCILHNRLYRPPPA